MCINCAVEQLYLLRVEVGLNVEYMSYLFVLLMDINVLRRDETINWLIDSLKTISDNIVVLVIF